MPSSISRPPLPPPIDEETYDDVVLPHGGEEEEFDEPDEDSTYDDVVNIPRINTEAPAYENPVSFIPVQWKVEWKDESCL